MAMVARGEMFAGLPKREDMAMVARGEMFAGLPNREDIPNREVNVKLLLKIHVDGILGNCL